MFLFDGYGMDIQPNMAVTREDLDEDADPSKFVMLDAA